MASDDLERMRLAPALFLLARTLALGALTRISRPHSISLNCFLP
jgi:hypothetical protein